VDDGLLEDKDFRLLVEGLCETVLLPLDLLDRTLREFLRPPFVALFSSVSFRFHQELLFAINAGLLATFLSTKPRFVFPGLGGGGGTGLGLKPIITVLNCVVNYELIESD
jgi:hypothetical protein